MAAQITHFEHLSFGYCMWASVGVIGICSTCGLALHTCVLCEDGRLLTFGWGSAGALGHGTTAYVLQAAPVDALHGHAVIVRRRLLPPLCLPRSQEPP